MDEEIIEVAEVETIEEIEVDEAIGWTGGDSTLHSSLAGRDALEQHPIKSIIGLKDALDEAKTLKTVCSDEFGFANYYKWDSGAYNDCGYFVSLTSANTISLCDGSDIFGVTVDAAAFVGGQMETTVGDDEYGLQKHVYTTDNTYALVATSGLVNVRCESGVSTGDYIVCSDLPNQAGIAKKTDSECGYKVVATETKNNVPYAVISLGVQACTTDKMGARIWQLEKDMDDAEINISALSRVANEAYSKALSTENTTTQDLADVTTKVDAAVSAAEGAQNSAASAIATSDAAKKIAESAVAEAESARDEAVKDAANALDKANQIEKSVEPIVTWTDPESGNVGATYYVEYIANGLSTKAEMEAVEKLDEENKLLITKNAESYQQMLSSVDKYSVGEHSQAYALTLSQAQNILSNGMIYIPIGEATFMEVYGADPLAQIWCGSEEPSKDSYDFWYYDETLKKYSTESSSWEVDTETEVCKFTPGLHYEWNGQEWIEQVGKVWFESEQPTGDAFKYWYNGEKLKLLKDGEWIEVATLAGNVNNRITNTIKQYVDSNTREIVNARGSGVSLSERLSNTDATIAQNAFWKKDDGTEYVAAFRQVAGEGENEGASLSLVAYKTDGSGNDESMPIHGASFVVGVDADGNDYIDFKADNINLTADQITAIADEIDLTGYVTIESLEGGETTVDGSCITTGKIQSKEYAYTSGNVYSTSGTAIDLKTGDIISENFRIDSANGSAHFNGVVHATDGEFNGTISAEEGTIGGWAIDKNGIANGSVGMHAGEERFDSLVSDGQSPIRFYAGHNENTVAGQVNILQGDGAYVGYIAGLGDCGMVYEVSVDNVVFGEFSYLFTASLTIAEDNSYIEQGSGVRKYEQTYSIPLGDVVINNVSWSNSSNAPGSLTHSFNKDNGTLVITASGSSAALGDAKSFGAFIKYTYNTTPTASFELKSGKVKASISGFGECRGSGTMTCEIAYKANRFYVLGDGSIYANVAHLQGDVIVNGGMLADLTISEGGLKSSETTGEGFDLNDKGIVFYDDSASLKFGSNFEMSVDSTSGKIKATGPLEIMGQKASIQLNTESADETVVKPFQILCNYYEKSGAFGGNRFARVKLHSSNDTKLLYDQDITLKWFSYVDNGTTDVIASGTESVAWYTSMRYDSSEADIQFTSSNGAADIKLVIQTWINNELIAVLSLFTKDHSVGSGYFNLSNAEYSFTQYSRPNNIVFTGNLIPSAATTYNLGGDSKRWHTVFCQTSNIESSDKNLKNHIESLSPQYSQVFDSLRPVSYKFNESEGNRTHTGLIAQDVKAAVESAGLTTKDFAGYCEWTTDDGGVGCGLRYGEFIALCINEIQKLKKRVTELEYKLNTTQND